MIVGDKFWGTNPDDTSDPVLGQGFAYAYDNIGNRTAASRDNEESIYVANNLNQYSHRTVADLIDIIGSAETNTTVTVNDLPTSRHEKYWHRGLDVTNDSSAVWQEINVVGVYNPPGTNDPDVVSSETGHVFVATTQEQFSYDDDGNILSDGRFNYSWDAENRLISAETLTNLPASVPRVKLEFGYDYMSRRVSKKVYSWSSSNFEFQISSISCFLYDGWNLVTEVCAATGKGTITDDYVWGLDLSGSLQGAGGIGGLLARYRSAHRYYDEQGMLIICHRPPGNPEKRKTLRINADAWPAHQAHGDTLGACDGSSVSNSAFLYTFDGNGNVSELLQSTAYGLQSISGHYEYSPFGELIVAAGPEAFDNPFRFSTKYWDDESGLYYYGYRYYSPSLGRWLSRDPVGEIRGMNLFRFVRNAPLIFIDKLGLYEVSGEVHQVYEQLGSGTYLGRWQSGFKFTSELDEIGVEPMFDCDCKPSDIRRTGKAHVILHVEMTGVIDVPVWTDAPTIGAIAAIWRTISAQILAHEEGHRDISLTTQANYDGKDIPFDVDICEEGYEAYVQGQWDSINKAQSDAMWAEENAAQEAYHGRVGTSVDTSALAPQ